MKHKFVLMQFIIYLCGAVGVHDNLEWGRSPLQEAIRLVSHPLFKMVHFSISGRQIDHNYPFVWFSSLPPPPMPHCGVGGGGRGREKLCTMQLFPGANFSYPVIGPMVRKRHTFVWLQTTMHWM